MSRRGENIYKRKDGRWEARYIKGRDHHGKAIYGYIYGKSYKEVKEKKLLSCTSCQKDSTRILFNDWIDIWLEEHRCDIKESTYVIYYLNIQNHIKPFFKDYSIMEINESLIKQFIKDKSNNGRLDHNGGLSAKTIKELINIIKSSMKYASKKQLIKHNSLNINIKINKPKQAILDEKDYKILVNYLKENINSINAGILLMMCTGLRVGEICALKNNDIDLHNNIITINKTLQRITDIETKKTKIVITHTKTNKSQRVVPIPISLTKYLIIGDKDSYFLTQSKKYMEPRTFRYAFKRKIKKLHLQEVTVHSLRHLFASQCIELGFDYNCLSEILGHSSPSTTMNLYVHSKTEYKKQCMNRIQI